MAPRYPYPIWPPDILFTGEKVNIIELWGE